MEHLLLFDAYSQIFRSFYAIRQLTNSRGEPVNAAFVFTKLLLKLHRKYPERRGIMLFDCGKVEFRLKLAPDYKANRPPMPDDLKAQIPLIKRIASAFGWKLYAKEGYEADDLIGVIARYCENSCKVMIVSSDKDLSQLVDENISMLVPQNGNKGDFEERTAETVSAKFGVAPELVVDYLALLGDSSDNIAGVPGIGAKGAAELLNTYGSADRWINDPEVLKDSKFYKKLSGNFELLERNRQLVRLRSEMFEELENALPDMLEAVVPDWAEIAEICRDNQFNSILKELPEVPAAPVKTADVENEEMDLFSFAAVQREKTENVIPEEVADDTPKQLELF